MGAQVTSTDISVQQLEIARQRAGLLGLEMTFAWADAGTLEGIPDAAFDLVCSTNGFFVWIAQPGQVFEQVYRVLKPGGCYIFYDIHPFQRPWKDQMVKDQQVPLEMERPYTATGPFGSQEPGQPTFEFHWRVSDLLNPLAEAGLVLRQLGESAARDARFWEGYAYTPGTDSTLLDWHANPRAGLPVWMTVAAQKPATR
jgi:ubiquinone/menaquinone biosynthesis C-methylase UbiE